MSFNTTKLTNQRVLVAGTDVNGVSGQTIVHSAQWDELNQRDDVSRAQEAFDAAVHEFFKPLTDAAEKAKRSIEVPEDSASYVVLDEGSEGEARRPRQVLKLSHDSIVLRLIEEGNTDRLIWVNGELEVTEASVAPTPSAPAAAPETTDGEDVAVAPSKG